MKAALENYLLGTIFGKSARYSELRATVPPWLGRVVVLALGLALSGCGYTLRHRLRAPFTDKPGIFVPVFDNLTDETGAERIFTNALVRELQSRGEFVITNRNDGAYELKGVVTSISYAPTAFTVPPFGGLQNYRRLPTEVGVTATVSLSLVDPKTGSAVWSNSVSGFRRVVAPLTRTYDFQAPSSLGLYTQSIIEARYSDIARDIARDMYDDMVELF